MRFLAAGGRKCQEIRGWRFSLPARTPDVRRASRTLNLLELAARRLQQLSPLNAP